MTPHPDGPEVDFVNLAQTIWQRRGLVLKLTGIAAITGLVLSLLLPNRYTASVTFVQEISDPKITLNEAKLSAISSLAAIAGVDLHGLTKAKMSPKTYAMIIASLPFRQELMQTRLNFGKSATSITLFEFYTHTEETMQGSFANDHSLSHLSPEEIEVNRLLDKQLALELHDDEYVTLSCTLPEAYAAAQLTQKAGELLQKYLTDIQTAKAKDNLAFVQGKYNEAKNRLQKTEEEVAASAVVNEKSTSPTNGKLSDKAGQAEAIYADLAQKLEEAKIELNEQTPVFKIINPVTVPTGKSYPNRIKITAISAFFGFVLALALILGKDFMAETKAKWSKS